MTQQPTRDIVIICGGHNGLICGAYRAVGPHDQTHADAVRRHSTCGR